MLLRAAGVLAGGALPGCTPARQARAGTPATAAATPARARPAPAPIRAICFDLFTLFDPRSLVRAAQGVVHERAPELCNAWRVRQFEYTWLRASAGRYADFRAVTEEALAFAAGELSLPLSAEQRRTLVDACSELEPWPDAREFLTRWRRAGLALAPLTNYSPGMLARQLTRAGLSGDFTALISSDAARTYKPSPRAYALGPAVLGLPRESIVFAASAGWDAAGARWFGFPTFWLNRLGAAPEALAPGPDASGTTLADLAAFVESRAM